MAPPLFLPSPSSSPVPSSSHALSSSKLRAPTLREHGSPTRPSSASKRMMISPYPKASSSDAPFTSPRRLISPGAMFGPSHQPRSNYIAEMHPQFAFAMKPSEFGNSARPKDSFRFASPRPGWDEGVSLAHCLHGNLAEQVADFDKPILSMPPPPLRCAAEKHPVASFKIYWQGYNHLDTPYDFTFMERDGSVLTVGDMARQIASIYQTWYKSNFKKFRSVPNGIRVGPEHVPYSGMRL